MSNLAQIHTDAKIGEGVEIGPFTTIYGDVVIGEGTWIGPNVTIMDGARIGKNCRIFPGAVISAIPQDLKFAGEKTTVEIGDNTTIRECCTLNRGTKDRMTTKVGSNCLLMAYVHLAHDAFVGDNCVIANSVTIGNWVVVEGVVAVQQFIEIGDHAFIAGGSLVRKNVPPFIKVAREPLSFIGVNSIGLRRRGYTDEQVSRLEDIYRALFVHNNSLATGVKQIVETLPESEEKQIVLAFIQRSEKGVVRGAQTT
jgi:UDP-N-acetylglucosamine acyltransferase